MKLFKHTPRKKHELQLALKSGFILLAYVVFLSSCARKHHSINPTAYKFERVVKSQEVELHYSFDAFESSLNTKNARRAKKRDIDLIAFKITNLTEDPMILGKDIGIFIGEEELFPMNADEVTHLVGQKVGGYVAYYLLGVFILKITDEGGRIQFLPVGLMAGAILAIINSSKTQKANQKLKANLLEQNAFGKRVYPQESIYGLLPVKDLGFNSLQIRRK